MNGSWDCSASERAGITITTPAFHGLHWCQVDSSGYLIWLLERLGLAREVYRVSPALMARRALHPRDTVLQTPLAADEHA